MTRRESWHAVATDLVDVAAGRAAADLVIRGGRWVNVLTREVVPGMDIAVLRGRIACIVEDAGYCIGGRTRVVEAEGFRLVDGAGVLRATLSAGASLTCAADGSREITYASAPLDVLVSCDLPEEARESD